MTDRTLISAARTLDVETGEWIGGRRLLVDGDGVIEAVLGPDASAPDDARPLDLGDGWVVPGLIDCHSHLVGDLEFAESLADYQAGKRAKKAAARAAAGG